LLADAPALRQMHSNALQASEHELRWEVESQHLIDLYRSLAKDYSLIAR
jgi:hypothetical protein